MNTGIAGIYYKVIVGPAALSYFRLENEPGVFRYSWYMSRIVGDGYISEASSLLKPDSSELTPLGEFYDQFQPGD